MIFDSLGDFYVPSNEDAIESLKKLRNVDKMDF